MHVFIDTNILLNFFHYSKDDLDALNDVFATHRYGSATVHLTEQVCNEFRRNREARIKDAINKFEKARFAPQFPYFLRGYEEYGAIRALAAELEKRRASLLEKITRDVAENALVADKLIGQILKTSTIALVSKEVYESAVMRVALGNPPGKNRNLGDSVNWLILKQGVPQGEDIHVISEDGDFYSLLDEERAHPFLAEEWRADKKGSLYVYRTLTKFMGQHFDGVAFSYDKEKDALMESLRGTGSFAGTHAIIAKLSEYPYFSRKEIERILDAASENTQFGWITTDYDVSDFLNRVAVPHLEKLTSDEHKKILQGVIEEQKIRERLK
jgi:hypothetical protein